MQTIFSTIQPEQSKENLEWQTQKETVPKRKMMMNPLSETPDETKIIQEFDSQEETSLTLRQCSGQSAFPYHSGISMLNLF